MVTRAKTAGVNEIELITDLTTLHDRFSRSELSQNELASWVGKIEGRLEETSQTMGKMMNMLEPLLTIVHMEKGDNSTNAHYPGERFRIPPDPKRPILEEMGDESFGERDLRLGNYQQAPRTQLPRIDFLVFSGADLVDWVEESEFYFDCYQVAENFKSRMASMHFTGEAREWYRCFKINNHHPPWIILKEEILLNFVNEVGKPMEEFKRVHQTGKIDDYVASFMRARARLMHRTQIDHEEFYVGSFIGGLKEEIRNNIDLFETPTLKIAISYAQKIKINLEGSTKKLSFSKATNLPEGIKGQ